MENLASIASAKAAENDTTFIPGHHSSYKRICYDLRCRENERLGRRRPLSPENAICEKYLKKLVRFQESIESAVQAVSSNISFFRLAFSCAFDVSKVAGGSGVWTLHIGVHKARNTRRVFRSRLRILGRKASSLDSSMRCFHRSAVRRPR